MPEKQITGAELRKAVDNILPQLTEFREDLHRHPELSWQEFRTTRKIREFLERSQITNFSSPLETGGILDIRFTEAAPFILLRADIDALPLQDEIDTPYRSQNTGICHACAHDVHTTVMIGVAQLIKKLNTPLPFNLRFVFQPAEESIPSGAPRMIEKGVLENVDYALGLHIEPRLPLGVIGLTSGWVNMQSIRVDITLKGPGGHSARPDDTADLIWIASRIIQDSYQIIYREINLLNSAVILTFTEIEAGQGYNVIPNRLNLTATLRLSDPEKKEKFLQRFGSLLRHLEEETGCRIQYRLQEGAPAIYNDPELLEKLRENILHDFWLPVKIDSEFRTPGGDDFSHYARKVPGAMIRFGINSENYNVSLHDGRFDIPPEVIKIAVSFFLHQLLNFDV